MIGTLSVDRPLRLQWTSGGRPFAIVSDSWRFSPRSATGATILTPGTYRSLAVRSRGRWTLALDRVEVR
jgi:hypothetical protein